MKAILGKKIGMSQAFDSSTGELTPVTLVDVSESVISRVIESNNTKTLELGFGKSKKASKADRGQYKELAYVPKKTATVKVVNDSAFEIGEMKTDLFTEGDKIEVKGVTKGKGFTGVMKRWNFKGGKRTHGQSDRERAPGSIGSGTTPGRVLKGKKMAGRSGRENVTIKNLRIVKVDTENKIIAVSGSVPGFNNKSYVLIKEVK